MYIVTLDDILYDVCKDRDHLKRSFGQDARYQNFNDTTIMIYQPDHRDRPFTATWTPLKAA